MLARSSAPAKHKIGGTSRIQKRLKIESGLKVHTFYLLLEEILQINLKKEVRRA